MTTSAIPTAAELKALFAARGIRPSRVRGQNFLVDAAVMRRVVEEASWTGATWRSRSAPGPAG